MSKATAFPQQTITGGEEYVCMTCNTVRIVDPKTVNRADALMCTNPDCSGGWAARQGSTAAKNAQARKRCRWHDKQTDTHPCPSSHEDHESLLCEHHRGDNIQLAFC